MELSEALAIEQKWNAYHDRSNQEIVFRPPSDEVIIALQVIVADLRGGEKSDTDVQLVIDAYHQHLPMLPKVSAISQPRKKKILAQWKAAQKGKPAGARSTLIDFWSHIFAYASQSDFLTGRRENDRGWKPNIDFFLQASSLTKLREGVYHGGPGRTGTTGSSYWV